MEGKDDSNVEKALEGALGRKGRPGRNRESLEDSSHIGSLAGSKKPGRSVLGRWAKKCAESLIGLSIMRRTWLIPTSYITES
jgi:hypothetical protein